MKLIAIPIIKEVMIQKLSSNKNVNNKQPKFKKKKLDFLTNKGEEISTCQRVVECNNLQKSN